MNIFQFQPENPSKSRGNISTTVTDDSINYTLEMDLNDINTNEEFLEELKNIDTDPNVKDLRRKRKKNLNKEKNKDFIRSFLQNLEYCTI